MNKHTKSGKCKKYSPYIKFSPILFYCKLCLNIKANRKDVHHIYHHLESKHKAEMATAETLMLNDKHQNNSIEVSANQKREQQFCKNTKDRLANESLESCGLSDMKFKYQSDLKNHQRTHSGVFHPDNKLKTKSENHIGYNTEAIKCAEKENYIAENQLKNETENIVLDFTVKKPEQNYYFKSVIADESIKLSTMSKSFKENILQPCEIVHAHKDEKFSCKFCGKSFATRAIVKRHEKIHALSPLERSYPCNFCGLRYMNKQSAINHQEQNCPIKGQLQDIHLNAQIASPNLEKVGNDYICMYKSCLFTNIHKEVKLFSILQIGIQKLKLLISILLRMLPNKLLKKSMQTFKIPLT